MLRISSDGRTWLVIAGEAMLFEVQLVDQFSQALDIPDDGLVLSLYEGGSRAIVEQEIGARLADGTGEYFSWPYDGEFTNGLFGRQLKAEIARRYKGSRVVLWSADLTIASSAATVPSLASAPVGAVVTRLTLKAAAQLGGPATATVALRPFEAPAAAPVFDGLPAIQHDGTPTAGETGTLTWGTIAGGTSSVRQVLLNGSALTGPIGGTITFQAGTYKLREVATGPGGSTEAFSVEVVVAARVPAPTIAFGTLDLVKSEGNSGTAIFSAPVNLSRDGSTAALGYSWQVVPAGANPADAADFGGTLPSGTGTFDPGQTSKTVTFLVSGDAAIEPDESFQLVVTLTGYNTITANGTIVNDDVAPSTAEYTFAQVGQGFTLFRNDAIANFLGTVPSLRQFGYDPQGSLASWTITGTKAVLRAQIDAVGNAVDGLIDVSINGGAWTDAPRAAGTNEFVLFDGADATRRVAVRVNRGDGRGEVLFPKAGTLLTVIGAPPAVAVVNGWVRQGEPNSGTANAIVPHARGNYTPAKIPDINAGPAVNVSAMMVRGTFSEIQIGAMARYQYLSIDGAAPTRYATQPGGGVTRVTGLTGLKTYYVWAEEGQVVPMTAMLAMGYVGVLDTSLAIRRMDIFGDSVVEAAAVAGRGTSGGESEVYRVGASLGYIGANHGVGGQTTEGVDNRLAAALANMTVTSADVFISATGRNDNGMEDPSASNRQARYASIIAKALAKGYGLVLLRGIIPESGSGLPSNAPMQAAVAAANDPRVKYIDTSGWSAIDRPDNVHPNDAGYGQLAAYAKLAYQAAGA